MNKMNKNEMISEIDNQGRIEFDVMIKKMIGKYSSAIITFCNEYRNNEKWDVKKDSNGNLFFGTSDLQNVLFASRFINLCSEKTGCILRVFTDQKADGFFIKEIYGFSLFIVNQKTIVQDISSNVLEECCNTDFKTHQRIEAEKNIVYCDLEGGRICSWDLK